MITMRTLAFDVELAAPPARAFAAITEGRHLERWFCDACESEPEEGGRLTMRWHRPYSSAIPYEATWIAFDPPRECSCRGGHEGYPNRDAGLIVFTVAPGASGTRLSVRHEMPGGAEYDAFEASYREAWPRALARLARYLEPTS